MHIFVVCLYVILFYLVVGVVHAVGVIVFKQRIIGSSLILEIIANMILWPLDFVVYIAYVLHKWGLL